MTYSCVKKSTPYFIHLFHFTFATLDCTYLFKDIAVRLRRRYDFPTFVFLAAFNIPIKAESSPHYITLRSVQLTFSIQERKKTKWQLLACLIHFVKKLTTVPTTHWTTHAMFTHITYKINTRHTYTQYSEVPNTHRCNILKETLSHSLYFTTHTQDTTSFHLAPCKLLMVAGRRMASYTLPLRAALSLLAFSSHPPLPAPRHAAVFSLSAAVPWTWIPCLLCIWKKVDNRKGNFHQCLAPSTYNKLSSCYIEGFFLHWKEESIFGASFAANRHVWTRR